MRVAVLSGKGGTGKTLLATHLADRLARDRSDVCYVDADVEEPDGHLFLRPQIEAEFPATVHVPWMARRGCDGCGDCVRFCRYHAIVPLPGDILHFPELCHGCGGCVRVCPQMVLDERTREIGVIREGRSGALRVLYGVLQVGETRSAPLIEALLARAPREGMVVIDGPPGTACAAAATVRLSDRILLVAEPTPAGLHDLQRMVELCRAVGRPISAVVNRCDLGTAPVASYLSGEGIGVWAEIPWDRAVAEAGAEGRLSGEDAPGLSAALEAIRSALAPAPQRMAAEVRP